MAGDLGALRPETRTDHALEGLELSLRHLVPAGQIVGREQEHLLDPGFVSRLEEALGAALGRAEEAEGIGDPARPVFGDRRGVEGLAEVEAGFGEPAQVRRGLVRIIRPGWPG